MAQLGARHVTSLGAALADAGVDAVWIATGTMHHRAVILEALGACKPTFCEKPISDDAAALFAKRLPINAFSDAMEVRSERTETPSRSMSFINCTTVTFQCAVRFLPQSARFSDSEYRCTGPR